MLRYIIFYRHNEQVLTHSLDFVVSQVVIIERITERLDELLSENSEIKNANTGISNELTQVSTSLLGNSIILSYNTDYS